MEIHKIVVPLDGSPLAEKALPFATKLARSLDAEILLLHAAKPGALQQDAPESELDSSNNAEAYLAQVREAITDPVLVTALKPSKVRNLVIYKEQMHELPEIATFEKADLIVMTTHGRTGLARVAMGSAASTILHHSALPVVLIRPETLDEASPLQEMLTDSDLADKEMTSGGERIVVTLDGSAEAELALPPAVELAHRLNATIYLLWVIPPYTPLYYADFVTPYQYDEKEAAQEAVNSRETDYKYLSTVQAGLIAQGLKCVKVVREGQPGPIIAGYAQALQASMLVMATHARNRAGRMLLGSVAEKVMRLSNLPVLMVNTRLYSKPQIQTASVLVAAV